MKGIFKSSCKFTNEIELQKRIEELEQENKKLKQDLSKYTNTPLLASSVSIDDLVIYDAGYWNKNDIDEVKKNERYAHYPSTKDVFSGIRIEGSKNGSNNPSKYWRVLGIENNQVVLVSLNSTERFYYIPSCQYVFNFLTTARNWDMYKNNYATKASILTHDLLENW